MKNAAKLAAFVILVAPDEPSLSYGESLNTNSYAQRR